MTLTEDWLNAHPKGINGVIAQNDDMGLGALDAIKAAVRDSIKTDDHPVGRILIEELERKVAAAA